MCIRDRTISHPTAGNSPITSDTVVFTVVSNRDIVSYLQHDGSGNYFANGEQNLVNGSLTIIANPSNSQRLTSFHSPEKDITITITMAAAARQDSNGNKGGEGGKSEFIVTLKQNEEYVVNLGSTSAPTGGSNGGGGSAVLYKKASVLVALGGGGGAGTSTKGGKGGGIGLAGENGGGRDGGAGGAAVATGELNLERKPRSGTVGGRLLACTIGSNYFRQNYSACEDYGLSKFLNYFGTPMEQSPEIQRGFKGGIADRNNGGNGSGNEGGGGSGANGGDAATHGNCGGGGGSGYTSGEVTVISTELGGNASTNAFITFEYYTP